MTIDDYIFTFVFDMALNDAVSRNAFSEKKSELFVDDAKIIIRKHIDLIINYQYPDFYETEKNVRKAINHPDFTFGNTQKLINMAIKYMYISYYNCKHLRSAFAKCHCPMDKIMIKKVTNKFRTIIKDKNDFEELKKILNFWDLKKGNISSAWSELSWSQIGGQCMYQDENLNPYFNFQKMVSYLASEDGLMPIEYDYKEHSNISE